MRTSTCPTSRSLRTHTSSTSRSALGKVLALLESLSPSSEIDSLKKTAFLLLLSTGWRISELHACVRDKEYCRISERNSLLLRPHPSFLAKNEHKKRIETREILTLSGIDGQTSQICPVAAIKEYLDITKESTVGSRGVPIYRIG